MCEAGFTNGALIFVTFAISLPALALQTNRGWVKAFGWSTIVCAMVTLSLGINVWFSTLKTRSNLRQLWTTESPQMQSLLQQRVKHAHPCTPFFPFFFYFFLKNHTIKRKRKKTEEKRGKDKGKGKNAPKTCRHVILADERNPWALEILVPGERKEAMTVQLLWLP